MVFKKAERKRSKARVAICGPSGSGKSYSALLVAKGLGGKVAAIDTENGSLSLYSHLLSFDVLELEAPYTPERYIEALKEAEKAGYDTLILDSITHEWIGKGGLLEIHDAMPGNSWANWSKVTPRHQKFIEAMIQSKCNIIATMRTKTEYVENEKNGKKTIEKAGAAPQQRDGMDYEFTLCLDVQQQNHIASASKDRTTLWDGRFEKISEAHGIELKKWLESESENATHQEPVKPLEKVSEPKPFPEEKKAPVAPPVEKKPETHVAPPAEKGITGKELADQLKRIREGAIKLGAKTPDEIRAFVGGLVGHTIQSATELTAGEREDVLAAIAADLAQSPAPKKAA